LPGLALTVAPASVFAFVSVPPALVEVLRGVGVILAGGSTLVAAEPGPAAKS